MRGETRLAGRRRLSSWTFVRLIVASMRPLQWLKNAFVLAPLAFSGNLFDAAASARAFAGFSLFCALSGAMYLLNDVADRDADAHHPRKQHRPIASERLGSGLAFSSALVVGLTALALSWMMSAGLFAVLLAFTGLNVAYSYKLRQVFLIDALSIASGFVLRVVGGAAVISVPVSPWLLLCTLLLALFIALGKRKHELLLLDGGAGDHRKILEDYSAELLNQLLTMTGTATLVTYSLYTFFSPAARTHPRLMLTIPFVLYAIYRYLFLLSKPNGGGSPEELLVMDGALRLAILGWIVATIAILYAA